MPRPGAYRDYTFNSPICGCAFKMRTREIIEQCEGRKNAGDRLRFPCGKRPSPRFFRSLANAGVKSSTGEGGFQQPHSRAVKKLDKLHQKRERSKKQGLGTRRFSACLYLFFTAARLFNTATDTIEKLYAGSHCMKFFRPLESPCAAVVFPARPRAAARYFI